MSDVTVSNHGSLIGLTVQTDTARNWASENLPEDAQWMGPTVFVEPRYAGDIIAGMAEDGLTLD